MSLNSKPTVTRKRQHSMIVGATFLFVSLLGMDAPPPFASAIDFKAPAKTKDEEVGEGARGDKLQGDRLQGERNDSADASKVGLRNFVMNNDNFKRFEDDGTEGEWEVGEDTLDGDTAVVGDKRFRSKASKQTKSSKKGDVSNGSRSNRRNGRNYRHDYKDMRIIGGSEAREDRYSFAVGLSDHIGLFCGGSMITKDTVLTAAHCQGTPYNVVIGRHDLRDKSDGEEIPAKRELPHPSYNQAKTDNDFMLVFLNRATTENIDLISLNDETGDPEVDDEATVMGWGDTDIDLDVSTLSDVLLEVDVNVISNEECDDSSGKIDGWADSYKGQITSNMLCAKANLQDSCQGDSGGPLVTRGGEKQIGVVSWGIGCASRDFPGVYARVSRAYSWIEREVCKGSDYASEAGFDCGSNGGSNNSGSSNSGSSNSGSGNTSGFGNNNPTKKPTKKPKNRPTRKPSRAKPSKDKPTRKPTKKPSKNNSSNSRFEDDFFSWDDDCKGQWCP